MGSFKTSFTRFPLGSSSFAPSTRVVPVFFKFVFEFASSYGVETWWDGVALASALLHDVQVHLGLDVAVQVVHAFEFDTT